MEEYDFSKDLNPDELAVANNQGIIFEECQYKGMDAEDYITKFMQCPVAVQLDNMESGIFSSGASQLASYAMAVMGEVKKLDERKRAYDAELYWIGYIYRYWSYLLGMPSNEIIEVAPVEQALRCYPAFHCMGNKEAIAQMLSLRKT